MSTLLEAAQNRPAGNSNYITPQFSLSGILPPNSAIIGYAAEGAFSHPQLSLSGTLPPNSAMIGYATEGSLHLSQRTSQTTVVVSALGKARVLKVEESTS